MIFLKVFFDRSIRARLYVLETTKSVKGLRDESSGVMRSYNLDMKI
jgi:hypothetical protein